MFAIGEHHHRVSKSQICCPKWRLFVALAILKQRKTKCVAVVAYLLISSNLPIITIYKLPRIKEHDRTYASASSTKRNVCHFKQAYGSPLALSIFILSFCSKTYLKPCPLIFHIHANTINSLIASDSKFKLKGCWN